MDWHLTQKFSIGVLLLLVSNIGTTIWWAAKLDTTVTNMGEIPARITTVEEKIIAIETENKLKNGLLGEFTQTLNALDNTISRIDREQARRTPMVNRVEQDMGSK